MTRFMGLVAVVVAAAGVTLATPATSEAGGWRRCRSYYVEPCGYDTGCCTPTISGCCGTWSSEVTPCCSGSYYSSGPSYYSGYYSNGRGLFSGYYRVGNVIINGRRWGDIGYRYSHGDLIRW